LHVPRRLGQVLRREGEGDEKQQVE
jgi:hypothetical protein